jgi:hypothetical protein
MRRSSWWLAIAIGLLAGPLLIGRTPARAAAPARSAEETRALERQVEELEQRFRQARDDALVHCRQVWGTCTRVQCKRIPTPQTAQWQACQDDCDGAYERCKAGAYELWPADE